MKTSRYGYYFASAFCFVAFGAFGWFAAHSVGPAGSAELASNIPFETAESCNKDRNYLAADLAKIDPVYRLTRRYPIDGQPPEACVSYIMQNFINLNKPDKMFAKCAGPDTDKTEEEKAKEKDFEKTPQRLQLPPCVTEDYASSVYNSLADVSDCLNLPMKELLPKLFNESGLNINALGGGYDGGVGQLTESALHEVFMPYDGYVDKPSALDWYLNEMKKSPKESCKRILKVPSAYTLDIPKGKKKCSYLAPVKVTDSTGKVHYTSVMDPDCYMPWTSATRCTIMSGPANPLRNILFTGVFYRSLLRNTTNMDYRAGIDYMGSHPYISGEAFGGYIRGGQYVERMKALGATHADQNVVKQIIISLGFNAGIDAAPFYLKEYLRQRELKHESLKDSDVDFVNTPTAKWAILTSLDNFWAGLSGTQTDLNQALKSLEVVGVLNLNIKNLQGTYEQLHDDVTKQLTTINNSNLDDPGKKTAINQLKVKYNVNRLSMLEVVYSKSDELTLPEYLKIAHAFHIEKYGGSPGYLTFIAQMYDRLEKNMGARLCTPDKYLQF